ncbi:cytochrome P450 CYP82D47-like [Sesamum indicum]|uniref:Flavonoid-6-hydroxylase n=1 Tax=Sesamum indicum TaxID=4182 RepID=A0A6I9UN59_SESIN|nr:cytochrome P450 CYP82D47-like [Sesamum indicum]
MEFSSALYAAITFFLLLYYYLLYSRSAKLSTQKSKSPPEAGGARPFTGHLHLMNGGTSAGLPHINLAALADKYGPVFTIRLGVRRVLIVSSWELAKELFTTRDVAISSRPNFRAAKHLSYDFAMFGFSPYGSYWRELRKLTSVELLSSRRLELLSHVRVSETLQSVNELYKLWEEKRDGSGCMLVDMKRWFGDLTLNVILSMVAGKRYCGVGADAEETRRCHQVLREFFKLAGVFVAADAMPYLGWLDIGGWEKRMKKTAEEMDGIVGGWLAEHREEEYSGKNQKPQDFMDVMLSAVRSADLQTQYDADTIIKATCVVLISGGSDTTTVMLVWTLSLLLNNRHVFKKAQEELDKHVGRERRVDNSDISNLVYLNAIIKETLRLYPAGPIGGTREFIEDSHIGGYHVPKGTWLIVNLWKLHRDPNVWGDDALEFKPERFLSRGKNVDVKGHDFELIPFGAGRRICPGVTIGLQMLHLVLANLLHAFEVSTVSDEMVDMSESAGLTNMKATPLDVLVAPRLPPTLYI